MREIKFRGMTLNGEWVYGLLAYTENKKVANGDTGYFISNSAGVAFAYHVRPETVGQFTGLKDKKEKEIYEGDIVKAWVDYGPGGEYKEIQSVVISPFGINIGAWCWKEEGYLPEILGNVHDNKDPLEGE